MRKTMDPVIHFELPAADVGRVRTFYESAFGWQTKQLGDDMGDFVLAFTVETDEETRMPQKRGAINGGFYTRTAKDQQTKITILVDDIHGAIERIKAAGGEILGEPVELPGVGMFASFRDPEGNVATINQDYATRSLPDN